jgi:hypothetical protein
MVILPLIASLLFAQNVATSAAVSGRVTMDDSSALPTDRAEWTLQRGLERGRCQFLPDRARWRDSPGKAA